MPWAAITDIWTTIPGIASLLIGIGTGLNALHNGDLNGAAGAISAGFVSSGLTGLFSNSKGTAT